MPTRGIKSSRRGSSSRHRRKRAEAALHRAIEVTRTFNLLTSRPRSPAAFSCFKSSTSSHPKIIIFATFPKFRPAVPAVALI